MHTFLGTSNIKYKLMFVFLNMCTLQWSKNDLKNTNKQQQQQKKAAYGERNVEFGCDCSIF